MEYGEWYVKTPFYASMFITIFQEIDIISTEMTYSAERPNVRTTFLSLGKFINIGIIGYNLYSFGILEALSF